MYKPLGQFMYIELEKETENTHVLSDGTELWLDTELEKFQHARQYGIIKYPTLNPRKQFDDGVDLQPGEKVYFHHFVCDERINKYISVASDEKITKEKIYQAYIDQVYCVIRDEDIVMLQDYVFVEPVYEDDSNYITSSGIYLKPEKETLKERGIVRHINKFSEDLDIKVGQKVIFQKACNYEMEVEGKTYYRMKNENILAEYED